MREFFSDGDLLRRAGVIDGILKGLTIQPVESVDNNFVDDVTNFLFDDGEMGIDLIAINMQRGRDHGVPGYVEYRDICGVGRATDFNDLRSNISPDVSKLLI